MHRTCTALTAAHSASPPDAMEAYYAHTATKPDGSPDPDKANWQPLYTGDPALPGHLEAVAARAAEFGAADWARLAGLWHDLGKFSAEFRETPPHQPDDEAAQFR